MDNVIVGRVNIVKKVHNEHVQCPRHYLQYLHCGIEYTLWHFLCLGCICTQHLSRDICIAELFRGGSSGQDLRHYRHLQIYLGHYFSASSRQKTSGDKYREKVSDRYGKKVWLFYQNRCPFKMMKCVTNWALNNGFKLTSSLLLLFFPWFII